PEKITVVLATSRAWSPGPTRSVRCRTDAGRSGSVAARACRMLWSGKEEPRCPVASRLFHAASLGVVARFCLRTVDLHERSLRGLRAADPLVRFAADAGGAHRQRCPRWRRPG